MSTSVFNFLLIFLSLDLNMHANVSATSETVDLARSEYDASVQTEVTFVAIWKNITRRMQM